ncbi:hypothetical protein FGO68_gene6883 [Halteria grandinella]|uniref:Uncharacterized protein n=1 Tax=Halteria grandinella TaxID=5974 RepID=A0A8J8TAE1_HALGN|nr:hypothetical protein FGO68_gene6883 [Halteria grandinella]
MRVKINRAQCGRQVLSSRGQAGLGLTLEPLKMHQLRQVSQLRAVAAVKIGPHKANPVGKGEAGASLRPQEKAQLIQIEEIYYLTQHRSHSNLELIFLWQHPKPLGQTLLPLKARINFSLDFQIRLAASNQVGWIRNCRFKITTQRVQIFSFLTILQIIHLKHSQIEFQQQLLLRERHQVPLLVSKSSHQMKALSRQLYQSSTYLQTKLPLRRLPNKNRSAPSFHSCEISQAKPLKIANCKNSLSYLKCPQ